MTITISCDNDGNITYSPSFYRSHFGDTITFYNPDGDPFEVVFKGESPGDSLFVSHCSPTLNIPTASQMAAYGKYQLYHYAAAVYKKGVDRVFLDSGCGDIAVGK